MLQADDGLGESCFVGEKPEITPVMISAGVCVMDDGACLTGESPIALKCTI